MGDIVPNAININGWDLKKKIIYGIVAEIKSWKKKKKTKREVNLWEGREVLHRVSLYPKIDLKLIYNWTHSFGQGVNSKRIRKFGFENSLDF